jgi:hypothetical protein
MILGKMLGAINPDVLQCVAVAVGETLGCYEKPIIEPARALVPPEPVSPQRITPEHGSH